MWIAFIFISLTYQKQSTPVKIMTEKSCELLSFLYLWHIRNSLIILWIVFRIVVNCFHFYIFDISETVLLTICSSTSTLWIAFIFISLTYQKQWLVLFSLTCFSCELLSFLYLWHIRNSTVERVGLAEAVVNCFHFYIFDISETVRYKIVTGCRSCELLSFLYLWHIRNSAVLINVIT